MSADLTREVRFEKGYDYRDVPNDGRGAHGMDIRFILRGPRGAIACKVSTGWMVNPLVGRFSRSGNNERRRGVGLDLGVWDHYPSGSGIAAHVAEPPAGKDWLGPDDCDVLPGGRCYGDVGYLVADEFVLRLVRDGEDAAWDFLAEIYADWLSPAAEGVTQ